MPDLEKDFEQKNLKIIARNAKKIKALYEGSIIEISLVGSTITLKEGVFQLSKYPQLKAVIDHELQKLHLGIYSTIVNSVKESWDLSNEKNDLIVDKRLAGKKPTANGERILYDPNKGALDEFIKRKEKGMNLSDRIWNSLEPFKTQLEGGLAIGISEGKSAASLARDLKSYLNDPDKLFRRVRDDNGALQLSKAAKDFHPGRGVYRSSYKNALRLTATETNIAYNAADQERWLKMQFVIGLKIQTSHNHPEFDICDELAGVYPKTFVWRRWHPFCICFQTAVQLSDEEYEKYEDKILAGEPLPEIKGITEVPKAFTDYVEKNKDRIEGYKSKPYWYKDNKQYLKAVEEPITKFSPAATIKDAEQFALKSKIAKEANYSGINLEIANAFNEEIFNTKNRFNLPPLDAIKTIDRFEKSPGAMAGYAYTSDSQEMLISRSVMENMKQIGYDKYFSELERCNLMETTNFNKVAYHETMHYYDRNTFKTLPELNLIRNAYEGAKELRSVSSISEYAFANSKEFLAELGTAKKFGKELNDLFSLNRFTKDDYEKIKKLWELL
jgi:hypothetical protein